MSLSTELRDQMYGAELRIQKTLQPHIYHVLQCDHSAKSLFLEHLFGDLNLACDCNQTRETPLQWRNVDNVPR